MELKLNIISLNHNLVRCPSLERVKSLILRGLCPHSRLGHTSDIHSHRGGEPVVSGSPTQQQISLTSPVGMVNTFSFCFVLVCLVIIDPVQQGDAQLSHPLCQVSAVPLTVWCSGLAILSVDCSYVPNGVTGNMYQMV